jgi:hypothetical protein
MKTYNGSCLCKAVAFEVVGEFSAFFFCHCSRCRKVTGSAQGANLFSQTAELRWLTGKDSVKTFRLPETRFARSFCTHCSTALPTQGDGRLVVPAGSLDCDVDVKPNAHIMMGSRANWDDGFKTLTEFETYPR